MKKFKQGFTLLEILLVVAAIAILAGIVILALNPGKQLAETKNAQRSVDVNTILNAVYQYSIDNKGILPDTIPAPADAAEICNTNVAPVTCATDGLINLSVLTAGETYLTAIPQDPLGGSTANSSGYTIATTTGGRVKVDALNAEQGATISVTR